MYEAIGLVEAQSIACGVDVADVMIKAARVDFIDTYMVTPGKFVVLVHGDPSAVASSVDAGRRAAADLLVDSLWIPFVHPQVFEAIATPAAPKSLGALGLIETGSVASGVVAADDAAKAAQVQLLQLHLARGIGGKSVLTLTGSLHDVEAAVDAGRAKAAGASMLVATRIIANPHPDLAARVLLDERGTRGTGKTEVENL